MDIVIKTLNKNYLNANIESFIKILQNEPYEYWERNHFFKEIEGKFIFSLMALSNNKLVGYIIASIKEQNIYIHKFMVDSNYRSFGIGSLLQKELEKKAQEYKYKHVVLSVLYDNKKAINFYKKNTYKIFDERLDEVNNVKLVLMKKRI